MESRNLQTVSILNGGQQTKEPNKKRSRIHSENNENIVNNKKQFQG